MTQKNITILSLGVVIFGAVIVNEMIVRNSRTDQDRAVASFGERFEPSQIKWEQELAKTVAKDTQSKTLIGKKPSLQDRLLFEVFEGRYEAKLEQGRIQKISLLDNRAPLTLNTDQFLKEYASAMKDFDQYQIVKTDTKNESIQLKDKSGISVGTLLIQRDDQGRVLTIEMQ